MNNARSLFEINFCRACSKYFTLLVARYFFLKENIVRRWLLILSLIMIFKYIQRWKCLKVRENELIIASINNPSRSHRRVALSYHIIHELRRFRCSLELQIMQRQFFGELVLLRWVPPELQIARPDTRLCVQKGRAEVLKDTVDLGRDEEVGWDKGARGWIRFEFLPHSRHSCDRRGRLDVEDCSSECLWGTGT